MMMVLIYPRWSPILAPYAQSQKPDDRKENAFKAFLPVVTDW
jgi:hypothetical protein